MNGFEERSEKKKTQIRQATIALLTKGKTFTIKDIAEEASVSQVSIYNYFGSKEALIKDVMMTRMEDTIEQYEELLHREVPFPESITTIMIAEQRIIQLYNGCVEQIGENEEFLKMVEGFQNERLIPFFIQLMETGKKLGYIQPNLEVPDLLFYFSMYKNELSRTTLPEEKFVQFFFYGLMGKPDE